MKKYRRLFAAEFENYFSELYTAHAVVKERFENKLMVSADDTGIL